VTVIPSCHFLNECAQATRPVLLDGGTGTLKLDLSKQCAARLRQFTGIFYSRSKIFRTN
jgi:hypothetical protein